MRPVLFELDLPLVGHVEFPAYLTMVMVGFLVCLVLARRRAETLGLDPVRVVDLALCLLVAGVVGARALAVLTDGKLGDFVRLCVDPLDGQRDCLAVFKFWQGGLTFYGGLLAAVPAAYWFCRRHRLDPWQMADLAAPLVMLGLAIGRIGCFLGGCCYGAPTDSWLGVDTGYGPGPLHPTQLYESGIAFALFVALDWRRRRAHGRGEIFGWMLVGYGAARIVLELWRADPRGSLGPFSTSQLISIPLIAAGAVLVVRGRRRAVAGIQ